MSIRFDTPTFAKRLTEAGERPAVAEAHAMAFKDFVMDSVATKADIEGLRIDIDAVKTDLRAEMKAMKTDLQTEIQAEGRLLRKDIDAMGLKLTVRMGGMLAVAAGTVAALSKIL